MSTYFAADVHLDPAAPATCAAWEAFLAAIAPRADALYILGDLFEMWIGDDDDDAFATRCRTALVAFAARTPLFLLHGNRDFLIGDEFAAVTGARLLAEPVVIDLYGVPTLLVHGDALCLADLDYQRVRQQLRSHEWQAEVLARPLAARRALGAGMREESRRKGANLAAAITDVDEAAAAALARTLGAHRMIHGHTHRPAAHRRQHSDSGVFTRYVLGSWSPSGGAVLRVQPSGATALVSSAVLVSQAGNPE